ncbi:MAG: putative RDD family membrane protein YckC [Arenicella sp.]|jgi:uncharacterized RDD family membrane protein YckC
MNDVNQNPYERPKADLDNGRILGYQYAGFWVRTVASLIDTVVILIFTWPLLYWLYDSEVFSSTSMVKGFVDVLLSYVFPLLFTITLWMKFGGTPGKRILKIKILDEKTGHHLTFAKSLLRYIGYFVSIFTLFVGFFWVAFDQKKKGWHDHIAGTIVVIG